MPDTVVPSSDTSQTGSSPKSITTGQITHGNRIVRRIPPRLHIRRVVRGSLGVPRVVRQSLPWDLLAGCCVGAFTGMTMPFFVKIARGELGAAPWAIGLMTASPFIGNLLAPFWARQMEGRAKMPFCIASWLMSRSLLFLMPLVSGAILFVGLVSGLQFITTISTPAYASLMRDIYPDRARGKLMGYVRVGVQAMMFLATLITGRLLDAHISFKTLFPIAALLGIAAAFSFSRVRPYSARTNVVIRAAETRPLSARAFAIDTLKILLQNRSYRWFALSVSVYGFGNLMVQPLYQLYQVDVLQISGTQIANLANFASIMAIFGAFFWGRFIDRHGPPLTVLWCIILVALIPIVYLFARSVPALFFASGLAGFGFAGIELSYFASILAYAEEGRAAQYQALHSMLLGIRGVIAPLVGIPLAHVLGYPPVFTLALVIMIIGAGLQWLATRTVVSNMAH